MVRGDIVGGIKVALSKGHTLQQIMQSFYNSGYKKEDIEEAARALKQEGIQQQVVRQEITLEKTIEPKKPIHPSYVPPPIGFSKSQLKPTSPLPTKFVSQPTIQQKQAISFPVKPIAKPPPKFASQASFYKPAPVQKQVVSNYGQQQEKKIDAITVILIIVLVLLLGVLAAVFFFREELQMFLNSFLD
ncbi:MAG: hypothetical protein ABIH59_02320 [archaeon]